MDQEYDEKEATKVAWFNRRYRIKRYLNYVLDNTTSGNTDDDDDDEPAEKMVVKDEEEPEPIRDYWRK